MSDTYLTAQEVARILKIEIGTVYAYVSRGLLHSEETGEKDRRRRYRREDVEKLQEQKEYRHDPAKVAPNAIHWGLPVLDSALTLIKEGELYYRGQNVRELATTRTFTEVATLFWTGSMAAEKSLFSGEFRGEPYLITPALNDISLLQKMAIALIIAGNDDLGAFDLKDNRKMSEAGARILKLMTSVLLGKKWESAVIGQALADSWGEVDDHQAGKIINAALILCIDHELNASSFTARVVASAEANPYQVVTAGLSALQGFKHGGNTLLVQALLEEIGRAENASRVIAARLRRGESLAGFGHPLYPEGDPRATLLLSLLSRAYPQSPAVDLATEVSRVIQEAMGRKPNIDFALVILMRTLKLPAESPLLIFALGRMVGWLGHAIEQYSNGELIRPRARYTGPQGESLLTRNE